MKRDLKTVRELIGANTEALLKIKDACEKEARARTTDEATEWTNLQATKRSLLEEEQFLVEAEEVRRRAANVPVHGAGDGNRDNSPGDVRDLQGFSVLRGLQLLAQNRPLDGREAEVHAEAVKDARASNIDILGFGVPAFLPVQQRAGQTVTLQTTNPGDQGGVTVATEVNDLIKALWSRSFLGAVGARRLSGLQGNQSFPVQLTKPTIQLVSEIQTLADDGILFGSINMSPNRRGTSIPVSKQLLLQSSIDVNALIIDNINMGLDVQMNIDAINALLAAITSSNGNLVALGTNGAAPDYAAAVALESAIANVDADNGNFSYLTNSKVRGKLKLTQKFASTNGAPVWENGEVNGYKAVVSNIVPSTLTKGTSSGVASAMIFGNFSDLYVGQWGGVDFVVDPYSLAKSAEVQITANMYWNIMVARAASFAGIKDALTA